MCQGNHRRRTLFFAEKAATIEVFRQGGGCKFAIFRGIIAKMKPYYPENRGLKGINGWN
jgi:hypothetical protein